MADRYLIRERTYEELAIEEPENHPVRWCALRMARREDGTLILRGRGVGQSITLRPEVAREFAKQVQEAVAPREQLGVQRDLLPEWILCELQGRDGGDPSVGHYVCTTGAAVVPNDMVVEEE